MVNWVNDTPRKKMSAEVMITYTKKNRQVTFAFTAGTLAVKFGHAERIKIGFDEYGSRICFMGGDDGLKINRAQNGTGRVRILETRILPYISPYELCGNYYLKKDEAEGYYYIPIGVKR